MILVQVLSNQVALPVVMEALNASVVVYVPLHGPCLCTERAISLVPNEIAKIMHLILAFSESFLIGSLNS